jgi:hypothetical protein
MRCTYKYRYFLFLVAVIIASCNNSNNGSDKDRVSPDIVSNPATANTDNEGKKNAPEIAFEENSFHFGEIAPAEKVTHVFKFKNTGNRDLVITAANGTCGCTVPEFSKEPVSPGEEGQITVTFDPSGKSGMVSKTINVLTNCVPNLKVLTISAEIIQNKK